MAYINICMERRRAEVSVSAYYKKYIGLSEDTYLCNVCGPFQHTDGDYATPVFVCELDDGRNFMAEVDKVRFMDTAGEIK